MLYYTCLTIYFVIALFCVISFSFAMITNQVINYKNNYEASSVGQIFSNLKENKFKYYLVIAHTSLVYGIIWPIQYFIFFWYKRKVKQNHLIMIKHTVYSSNQLYLIYFALISIMFFLIKNHLDSNHIFFEHFAIISIIYVSIFLIFYLFTKETMLQSVNRTILNINLTYFFVSISTLIIFLISFNIIYFGGIAKIETFKKILIDLVGVNSIKLWFFGEKDILSIKDIVISCCGVLFSLTVLTSIPQLYKNKRRIFDYSMIGRNLMVLGEFAKAKIWLNKFSGKVPSNSKFYYLKSINHLGLFEVNEAINHMNKYLYESFENSTEEENSNKTISYLLLLAAYITFPIPKPSVLTLWEKALEDKIDITIFFLFLFNIRNDKLIDKLILIKPKKVENLDIYKKNPFTIFFQDIKSVKNKKNILLKAIKIEPKTNLQRLTKATLIIPLAGTLLKENTNGEEYETQKIYFEKITCDSLNELSKNIELLVSRTDFILFNEALPVILTHTNISFPDLKEITLNIQNKFKEKLNSSKFKNELRYFITYAKDLAGSTKGKYHLQND